MTVTVRTYTDADYGTCRELWVELTQHHRDIYSDQSIGGDDPGLEIDTHLKDRKRAITWIAEREGGVLGFCSLLVDGEGGEIDPIVVRASERSRGIGTALLDTAIAAARQRGVRFLSIRPVARNVDAVRLYYDAGFRLLGQVDMFMDLTESTPRNWKSGVALHGREMQY